MLLTTVPYICSKTASCWDILEKHFPPLHSLSLLFCWGQGNATYYTFSLDTGFIIIWDPWKSETQRSPEYGKTSSGYFRDFLAQLLSCSLRIKYKQLQLFSTYFFVFVASKSNIADKFIRLKYERKKSVLRKYERKKSVLSITLLGLKKKIIYISSQKGNDGKLRL